MLNIPIHQNIQQAKEDPSNKKIAPHNMDAEQAVIGAFLHNNESVNRVSDILLPIHFFIPIHQKIYNAIIKLMDRSLIATPLTLKGYFIDDEAFKEIGVNCFDYLLKLVSNADLIVNVKSLAYTIHDLYIRRQLIDLGQNIVMDNYEEDPSKSAHDRLEIAEHQLFTLATQGSIENNFVHLNISVNHALTHVSDIMSGKKKTSGVSSGFGDMDKMTGGLHGSDLVIIAARPSMGKTAFAVKIALNVAEIFYKEHELEKKQRKNNDAKNDIKSSNDTSSGDNIKQNNKSKSVVIFSLEMSSEQIANRILSIRSGLDSSRIRMGELNKDEFTILSRESAKVAHIPLFVDDSAALTISAIRTRARRMKRQQNVGLIVVDYLQLIKGTMHGSNINRVQEIGEISQGLKALAKELNIPIIALSQLSRAVENRDDKKPQLADLRESGNIEQDADMVAFLYREEYYLKRKMPLEERANMEWQNQMNEVRNIAEIIISKQRNGPVGNFMLHFNSATTDFTNLFKGTIG